MDINQCYKVLNIASTASNDDVSRAFKQLAIKYHPDKNRNRVKWANDQMTSINIAYAGIMSHRFKNDNGQNEKNNKTKTSRADVQRKRERQGPYNYYEDVDNDEYITNRFIKLRENAKESLYNFFQYSIFNLALREKPVIAGKFNRIVLSLRKTYHSIKRLSEQTENQEIINHLNIFIQMLFNFYKASECLNIIDSFSNPTDVRAFRSYRLGDEALHSAQKEIFYDRHNRGSFNMSIAYSNILRAIKIFKNTLKGFPKSSWAVETRIKLEYALSLKQYMELFFNED